MKNAVTSALAGLLAIGVAACAGTGARPAAGPTIEAARAEAYDGPKARIAVADFEDKMSSSGHYRGEYGRGMSDMLATALFESNRYIVLEREKLQAVIGEQNLGASGRVKRDTAAAIGEIEGADLLITAAITGFDPGTAGAEGGVAGALPNWMKSLTGGFKRAHVAMDLRVLDTRTARVLAAAHLDGSATAFSVGGAGAGARLGGALSGFSKTPMESAIREMIRKAVAFVVAQTPATYYRAGAAQPARAAAAPGRTASVRREAAPARPGASRPTARAGKPAAAAAAAPDEEDADAEAADEDAADAATDAAAPAPGQAPATRLATARAVLQTIRTDHNRHVIADLTEVTRRGAFLTVVVSLRTEPNPTSDPWFELRNEKSAVLDYSTGETYPLVRSDGFVGGRVNPGEVKTLRATFKAPKEAARSVAITLAGIGTFDDVPLGR